MLDRIKMVKRKMDESLEQLCEVSWMFSRQPEKDFTRNRKLSFPIPRSRECSGWWTEKGKHKIVLRDKRKPCGGGCTDHLPPYQFALGVNGVTK